MNAEIHHDSISNRKMIFLYERGILTDVLFADSCHLEYNNGFVTIDIFEEDQLIDQVTVNDCVIIDSTK